MPIELQVIRASEFIRLDAQEHLDVATSKEVLRSDRWHPGPEHVRPGSPKEKASMNTKLTHLAPVALCKSNP